MNLGTKKSYYVFSKTDIKKFKEENNKPLEYIDLIKLVIDTNSELLKSVSYTHLTLPTKA